MRGAPGMANKDPSPTKRAMDECNRRGWRAAIVEKWIPHTPITQDLFGFADIIALDGENGSLLIQVTSLSNVPSRVRKVVESQAAKEWLEAGNRIEVWGWGKRKNVKKAGVRLWRIREVSIVLEDIQ